MESWARAGPKAFLILLSVLVDKVQVSTLYFEEIFKYSSQPHSSKFGVRVKILNLYIIRLLINIQIWRHLLPQ